MSDIYSLAKAVAQLQRELQNCGLSPAASIILPSHKDGDRIRFLAATNPSIMPTKASLGEKPKNQADIGGVTFVWPSPPLIHHSEAASGSDQRAGTGRSRVEGNDTD
jgi:hypothetical protein